MRLDRIATMPAKLPVRALLVLPILALSWGSASQAFAQAKHRNPQAEAAQAEKKKKAEEADAAYKASLRAIPDKAKKADPWSGMR